MTLYEHIASTSKKPEGQAAPNPMNAMREEVQPSFPWFLVAITIQLVVLLILLLYYGYVSTINSLEATHQKQIEALINSSRTDQVKDNREEKEAGFPSKTSLSLPLPKPENHKITDTLFYSDTLDTTSQSRVEKPKEVKKDRKILGNLPDSKSPSLFKVQTQDILDQPGEDTNVAFKNQDVSFAAVQDKNRNIQKPLEKANNVDHQDNVKVEKPQLKPLPSSRSVVEKVKEIDISFQVKTIWQRGVSEKNPALLQKAVTLSRGGLFQKHFSERLAMLENYQWIDVKNFCQASIDTLNGDLHRDQVVFTCSDYYVDKEDVSSALSMFSYRPDLKTHADYYSRLAFLYVKNQQPSNAIGIYSKLVHSFKNNGNWWFGLGWAYHLAGKDGQAKQVYKKAYQLADEDADYKPLVEKILHYESD